MPPGPLPPALVVAGAAAQAAVHPAAQRADHESHVCFTANPNIGKLKILLDTFRRNAGAKLEGQARHVAVMATIKATLLLDISWSRQCSMPSSTPSA